MKTQPGVLCSGSIVYDTLVRPGDESCWGTTSFVESIEYHVGGNGANSSIALAILGVPVRLLGAIGRDDQARFVLKALRAANVDISHVVTVEAATAATIVIVSSEGDRKFLHRLGASAYAFPDAIEFTPELLAGVAHYHSASLFVLPSFRAHAPETLRRARQAGLSTSLDTNWDAQGRWMQDLAPCLPHVDVLFLNEDEARMLTGSSDPQVAAANVLSHGVRTAVMKLGPRGCTIYTNNDREVICPAFEVDVKDTTGAGDCFVAGFLAASLRGATLSEAGCFGNAVAAQTVQNIGAVTGIPGYDEVDSWMHSNRS